MDFYRLYTFLKVAERENITKAASDLYLTQQAISKQLLQLEDELQLKLFNRSHNLIHLTRDGQSLMEEVRPLFEKIETTVSTLQGKASKISGTLRIGGASGLMVEGFYNIIQLFKSRFPNVKFELTFDTDYAIEDRMMANEIDIGLLFAYREHRVMSAELIETRKYAPCCSLGFHKKYGPFEKYHNILGVPFAEFTHQFASFGRWIKLNCPKEAKLFMQQQPEVVVYDANAVESFVKAGICMGFVDTTNPGRLANLAGIVELFPKAAPVSIDLNFVTKKKETERLVETEFKAHLLANWSEDVLRVD